MSKHDHKSGAVASASTASAATAAASDNKSAAGAGAMASAALTKTEQFFAEVEKLSMNFDHKQQERGFFWSNDDVSHLNLAAEFKQIKKVEGKINIGIIIGEGHFISFLPELTQFLDGILFLNIDSECLEHIKLLLKLLNESKSRREFWGKYFPHLKQKTGSTNISFEETYSLLGYQNRVIGDKFFFLLDEKRFQLCKQHAKKIAFAYNCMDFLKPEQLAKVFALFAQHQVHVQYVNITNLMTWDDNNQVQMALDQFAVFKPLLQFSQFNPLFDELGANFSDNENKCVAFLTRVLNEKEMALKIEQWFANVKRPTLIDQQKEQIKRLISGMNGMSAWVEELYNEQPDVDPKDLMRVFMTQLFASQLQQNSLLSMQGFLQPAPSALSRLSMLATAAAADDKNDDSAEAESDVDDNVESEADYGYLQTLFKSK